MRVRLSLILLCAGLPGLLAAQSRPDTAGSLAAVVGDRQVSMADLDALVADRLVTVDAEAYAIRRRALDAHVDRLLLEQEAARRGVSEADLLRTQVEARLAPITDDQVRAVYDSRVPRPPGEPAPAALAEIRTRLMQTRAAEARRAWLDALRRTSAVRVLLEPPRATVDVGEAPFRGPRDAPVTIALFSDFQCPFCRAAAVTFQQLVVEYDARVRLVFLDFPLATHAEAPKAAEAARCAGEQAAFWPMHDALFGSAALRVPDLKAHARTLGLDGVRFDACLDSGRQAPGWQRDRAIGQRLGITATPTFFINGRLFTGALPASTLRAVIDEELARSGSPRP